MLAIATNIPVLLMTAFVLQGHIYEHSRAAAFVIQSSGVLFCALSVKPFQYLLLKPHTSLRRKQDRDKHSIQIMIKLTLKTLTEETDPSFGLQFLMDCTQTAYNIFRYLRLLFMKDLHSLWHSSG